MNTGTRYLVEDLTAKTESMTDDLNDALWRIDFLHKKLNHRIRMTNTQNGDSFDWESL